MSIPSNPFNMPPNIPPSEPAQQFTSQNQPEKFQTSNADPTGAWAAFLSTPGHPASAEQVKAFMEGMLKMFNVIIQQQNQAVKKANERLKRASKE